MAIGARDFGAAARAGGGRAQLGALVWLKWRLLLNSLRSRRGAANRAASAVGTLAAALLSLLFAAGLGAAGYWLARASDPAHAAALQRGGDAAQPMLLLFGLLSMLLLMWALVPLSLGGGTGFDPGPLLLYPISLRKLFLVDLLSELSSLSTLFAAPSLVAVGLGAGLASGRVAQSLAAAGVAACFGAALAKLVSTAVASLMQARRARGEMLLAALGIVGAFSGLIVNRGFELIRRTDEFPAVLRWTPPGALVSALTAPRGGAGLGDYLLALATLGVYAAAAVALTYVVAVRSLRSSGGAGKRRAAGGRGAGAGAAGRAAAGWRVPLLPVQLATVFEKEMRYALRNAQLRVIVLMPVVVTVALSFGFDSRRRGFGDFGASSPYFAGVRDGLGMFYVFVILSALGGNLFGFDGAGARAYVLAPIARRTILLGKNLAVLCVAVVAAVAVTVTNRLIHGGAGWGAHLFAALCFVHFAAFFQLVGNYTSVRFPRRLQFGRRMNASGVSGLLMIPTMLAALLPPALAAVAGWLSGRVWIEYVILAAFASMSVAAYLLLIGAQGRELERRELDILEVVTGRDDA